MGVDGQRIVVRLAAALVLVGCGGGSSPYAGVEPTPPPAETDVLSMAVDPGDGTLMIATAAALYRVAHGAREPQKLDAAMSSAAGSGPLRDLVMRFAAPGTLVASGHSVGGSLPNVVGLISSPDRGRTWQAVSGTGKADYHELEVTGARLVGLRADNQVIYVSSDRGRSFSERTPPAVAATIDVSVDPGDPTRWAVSTEQGTFVSVNEGGSWRHRDPTFGARLVWAPNALYSVGRDGKVKRTQDGGRSWQERGTVGAGPKELVASARGELYAAVAGGEVRRSSDGGATWRTLVNLGGA
jgi:photosystem II stability/assembly factor-like uncharacterized protein